MFSAQAALHICVEKVGVSQPEMCLHLTAALCTATEGVPQPWPSCYRESPSRDLMILGLCMDWGMSSLWIPVPKHRCHTGVCTGLGAPQEPQGAVLCCWKAAGFEVAPMCVCVWQGSLLCCHIG